MKKKILLVLLLFSKNIYSQNLSVKSFKILENDLTAKLNGTSEKDLNNRLCAIIKVQTLETGFDFDNGTLGIINTIQKKGEIWVYVPRYTKFLTISHSKLGVLRNYAIPIQINEGTVYELVLISGKINYMISEESINGFLTLETDPTDCIVEINGVKIGLNTPFSNYSIPEGEHEIKIYKKNYKNIYKKINIIRDENNKFNYNLKLLAGNLNIKLKPEINAEIILDGNKLNKLTPFTLNNILIGNHTLLLQKDLYQPIEKEFTIDEDENKTFELTMIPLFGTLEINTNLDNAEIWLNKYKIGYGEYKGKLNAGNHFIEIKKENYYPIQKNISLNIGDKLKENFELKPKVGSLSIITDPYDISFSIDDKIYNKKTPVTIRDLIIGNYTLKFIKNGYRDIERNIIINENKNTEIKEKVLFKEDKPPKFNLLFGISYNLLLNNSLIYKDIEFSIGLLNLKNKLYYGLNSNFFYDEDGINKFNYFYQVNTEVKYFIGFKNFTDNNSIFFSLNLGYGYSEGNFDKNYKGEVKFIDPKRSKTEFELFKINYDLVNYKGYLVYDYFNLKSGIGYYLNKINTATIEIFYNLNYGNDYLVNNLGLKLTYFVNLNRNRMKKYLSDF